MLRIGTIAGCVFVGLGLLVFAQDNNSKGGDGAKKAAAASPSTGVRKALAERLDIPEEFRQPGQPVLLKQVLHYIDENLSMRQVPLDINIDQTAFKEEASGDPIDIMEVNVVLPSLVRSATVQEILELAVRQLPAHNGTFLIRNGRVDILTHDAANIVVLLDRGIALQIRDLPLKAAIEEVADRTGLTVMIDPRCGAELNRSVSVQTQNDISPRGILSSWADMFELKLLVDEHRVLLMPRTEYLKKLRDQVEETQMQMQIQKNQGAEIPQPEPPRNRGRKTGGMAA